MHRPVRVFNCNLWAQELLGIPLNEYYYNNTTFFDFKFLLDKFCTSTVHVHALYNRTSDSVAGVRRDNSS